jgi:hypothetical protein
MDEAGDLTPDQWEKLELRLQEWVRGEGTIKELEFVTPEPEGVDEVPVVVQFSEPPSAERAAAITTLGLAVMPDETVLFGQVTRESLVALARDPLVVRIEPSVVLPLFEHGTPGEGF